jgi:ring-1,2-phenylacetyl-CoA epoxidase subunit PaaC
MTGSLDRSDQIVLQETLLAFADDELILGHRDSQWCGHAPILEEDIAFANIALDEIGHAAAWYAVLSDLMGQDPETYPDRLVFFRDPPEYRCAQMVELPNRDWAFSMLRQYLFDALEKIRLPYLAESTYLPLAEVAGKVLREEAYHYRHTRLWVRRLSLGTQESHYRMQRALTELWPYTMQVFDLPAGEVDLVEQALLPTMQTLLAEWLAEVLPFLIGCGLEVAGGPYLQASRSEHTPDLLDLLADLQKVARLDPLANW